MDDQAHIPQRAPEPAPASPSRHWIGPVVFALVIIVPVLILIFSNTRTQRIDFAGGGWDGPLWVILAITFVAGAVLTRLLSWIWRTYSRRRRKARGET